MKNENVVEINDYEGFHAETVLNDQSNFSNLPEYERYIFTLIEAQRVGYKCNTELSEALGKWREKLRK